MREFCVCSLFGSVVLIVLSSSAINYEGRDSWLLNCICLLAVMLQLVSFFLLTVPWVGLQSAVCDRDIAWSYLFTFFSISA